MALALCPLRRAAIRANKYGNSFLASWMFTLIVLVLSGLILAARSRLLNAGDVVVNQ